MANAWNVSFSNSLLRWPIYIDHQLSWYNQIVFVTQFPQLRVCRGQTFFLEFLPFAFLGRVPFEAALNVCTSISLMY